MTKESRRLITDIYNRKIWDVYDNPYLSGPITDLLDDDLLKRLNKNWKDGKEFYATYIMRFPDLEKATAFRDRVQELIDPGIHMIKTIQIGQFAWRTDSPGMFGMTMQIENILIFEIERDIAKELFDSHFYMGDNHHFYKNFLSWIRRNNDKHWDDILGFPEKEVKFDE